MMKKFFYLAIAAVMSVALASCDHGDKPGKQIFTFEVADITGSAATITVKSADHDAFYWDIVAKETLADYASVEEYWNAEVKITAEDFEPYAALFEQLYGIATYEEYVATMKLVDEDTYTYSDLTPETEYVIFAFKMGDDMSILSAVETSEFTTGEGDPEPTEEEIYYQLEPTTPISVAFSPATLAQAETYGDFYQNSTSNFGLAFQNAAEQVAVLDIQAPAGQATLPAGNYTVAQTGAANTLIAGDAMLYSQYRAGSYVVVDNSTALWITEGTLAVAVDGANYTITGTLRSHYGSTINIAYNGPITFQAPQQGVKKHQMAKMPKAPKAPRK